MFTLDAGPVTLNVSFLSPVEPTNLVRQSFPFAYMYVDAMSKDGQAHSVQLYTDVDASLISTRNDTVEWNTTHTSSSVYHDIRRRSASSLELYDVAENGNLFYAMTESPAVTWQTGTFRDIRAIFTGAGKLNNAEDTLFRASQDQNHTMLAFAVDLGNIINSVEPVVWAIGHVRESLLLGYGGTIGVERRVSYFWSQYLAIKDGVHAFLADFPEARARAQRLDEKLKQEGSFVSDEYADLVALSLRQTLGAIEITLPRFDAKSGWNTSDVQAYMRDMGVSKRANPVEAIYAAMPALLYLNPKILMYLLKPLFAFQSSDKYQNAYASPDLGNDYLTATGNGTNTKKLGVEHSGNMLIMAAAYGMQTKDWTSLNPYAKVMKTWADFLVTEALHTRDQMSADGLTGENQSNLAMKGILGIYAMSKIREALGPNGEETYFRVSLPSLFLWPPAFGLAYDSADPHVVKSHWTMFAAAASTSARARDKLIRSIHDRAFKRSTAAQFGTTYNADTGASLPLGGRSSPAQGAVFALLVTDIQGKASDPSSATSTSKNIGGIVGGVIGGIAGLALLAVGVFFCWRRWKNNRALAEKKGFDGDAMTTTSFSSPEVLSITARSYPMTPSRYSEMPSELVPVPFDAAERSPMSSPSDASDSHPSPALSKGAAERARNAANTARRPQAQWPTPSEQSDDTTALSYLPPSSTASHNLHQEVEELRREVGLLRAQQQQMPPTAPTPTVISASPSAPPPYYSS
ncbi:glutaminase [Ephemerocybe angulata]|uniref:Glutaminase n=1 Tax=Ephemerocybe angulata TaxID=980116 RepID=A0A8H6I575_9AGAR|nr:glutaminase [Tulosesus angulatus]